MVTGMIEALAILADTVVSKLPLTTKEKREANRFKLEKKWKKFKAKKKKAKASSS